MEEEELSKLVQLGEKMGLSGDKLYEFVNDKEEALRKKEEDRIAREERAAEREARRIEQGLESRTKVALLERQIQLEKVNSGTCRSKRYWVNYYSLIIDIWCLNIVVLYTYI